VRARRMDTTYYLGREQLIPVDSAGLARWRKKLFAVMARNARSACSSTMPRFSKPTRNFSLISMSRDFRGCSPGETRSCSESRQAIAGR